MSGAERFDMFGQNMYLLLGLLVVGGIGLLVLFVGWSVLRAWVWQKGVDRATRALHDTKFRPDGTPYPPAGQGICDCCKLAFKKVYYVSTDERLCPSCYADAENLAETAPGDESRAT